MTTPTYYTVAEVAAMLDVHENTVYRWITAGHLPALQAGPRGSYRIRQVDIEDMYRTVAFQALTRG